MKVVLCLGLTLFVLVKANDPQYCTQSSFSNLLSRRRRFLTYPDGSSFAVKRSFSKAIIDNRPRGMVLNIDCGIYYPLPGSKDPWNPAKFLYRLDLARTDGLSATARPQIKPKIDVDNYSVKNNIGVVDVKNSHPNLYFPSRHHWIGGNRKSYWHGTKYYTNPMVHVNKNYLKSKQYDIRSHQRRFNASGVGLYYSTPNIYSSPRVLNATNLKNYEKKAHFESATWAQHREYRERREVYARSEGLGHIFGINMKACMMRAICEMNEDSLPPGKSFILDIAHILFDLPTDHDFEDDYGKIAREKNVDCAKRFHFSCPYSPMEFLTHNVRLNGVKDPNAIKNSIVYV